MMPYRRTSGTDIAAAHRAGRLLTPHRRNPTSTARWRRWDRPHSSALTGIHQQARNPAALNPAIVSTRSGAKRCAKISLFNTSGQRGMGLALARLAVNHFHVNR
jgi:hypothetical protein